MYTLATITNQELLFGALLFGTVAIFSYALSGMVFKRDPLARRLHGDPNDIPQSAPGLHAGREGMSPMVERISHAAARPFMPKTAVKQSSLRKQLMHAGIYTASAMEAVVGLKVILL